MNSEPLNAYINKRTLIIGEVNTGKTAYLGSILSRFLEDGQTGLTIIDMAPETAKGIGGKMSHGEIRSTRYFTTQIMAPRLMGGSQEEVEALAKRNALLIDNIFSQYLKNPSKVLLINDVSIYLQSGDLDKLLLFLKSTPTVIMNGYFGYSLGGGKLGKRERENMKSLQERCDRVISLPSLQ